MTSTQVTSTQALLIRAKPNAPIACNMKGAPDTPRDRFAEYGRLFAHALIDRRRTGDAVVFTFAAKPGVAEWVTDLARREAACCSFCEYDVTVDGKHVVWRVSSQSGPVVQAFLDEFHALPERIGDGLEALFARLTERGVAFEPPG